MSTGPHDYPIPDWDGNSRIPMGNLLIEQAFENGDIVKRLYKLDAFCYVAENENGEIVGQIGELPPKISGLNLEWLDYQDVGVGETNIWPVEITENDETLPSEYVLEGTETQWPPVWWSTWDSWYDLKSNYQNSYQVLLEKRRRNAVKEWRIDDYVKESGEGLVVDQAFKLSLLYPDSFYTVEGDGSQYCEFSMINNGKQTLALVIVPQSIPPQESNSFTVNINHSNGVNESFKFFIVDENIVANQEQEEELRVQQSAQKTSLQSVSPKGYGSWSNWTYYWAGTHDDQRLYGQFKVNGCWSGCGATAWAMLFCWADHQAWIGNSYWAPRWGLYLVNGGKFPNADADAPKYQDTSVNKIILEIRDYIDTFCISDSGATWPWNMSDAYKYFNNRTGTKLSTHFSYFGFSDDSYRNYAIKSIRDRNTPAIIGIGWLEHYPLAYGYKWRKRYYYILGYQLWSSYNRDFYVNQGWYGSGNGWVTADTWFAGEIYP